MFQGNMLHSKNKSVTVTSWPKMLKSKSNRVQHNKETTRKSFTILSKDSESIKN